MTDLKIIPWIRDHDEVQAVGLARSLIHAEAGRLGLPLDQFTMSSRVKVGDEGIDGRTHFPTDTQSLLPAGPQVWQIKSGRTPPRSSDEFDSKHKGLIEAIRNGYNYVLFWTNDPVDPAASSVMKGFREAVKAIRPDAEATFLFADNIERLCYAHLAVLFHSPLLPLGATLSLTKWGARQDFAVDYQADEIRLAHVRAIRDHVSTENRLTSSLHVYGDTGVGKSRLVFEALRLDGIAQRVLVAPDPRDVNRALLAMVVGASERRLILVVDECTPGDRKSLSDYVDLAEGRIRLVTIGSRYSREQQSTDQRYLELPPLTVGASRHIAESVGLSQSDADLVARYTEGYPKLAYELARAILLGGPSGTLLERVRSEAVGSVLSSMLSNRADVELLGGLALFERLGFEHDLAVETTIACQALGLDESAFREVVDRELNRFVSSAGRFRLVTPRLFAVWLATEFIRGRPNLAGALKQLPEALRDRVIGQMKEFAGDSRVAQALRQLMNQPPFLSGAPSHLDEGSARLLHVAAIIDPPLAIEVIERFVSKASVNDLRENLVRARRSFVYALEVLIWFDETFERAATALLKLALAENETWSNNATGAVQGLFRVYLGGTSASYERRIRWARRALERIPGSDRIIVPGLGNALQFHEMRTSTDFASRTAPIEWRPSNFEEDRAARRSGWRLLVEFAREGRMVDEVSKAIGDGLRTAVRQGLAEDLLRDIPSVQWPPQARGRITEAINHLVQYDDPPGDLAERLRRLRSSLIGVDLDSKLSYLLSQEQWKFYDDERPGRLSPLLTEVAQDLLSEGPNKVIDAARTSRKGVFGTAMILFEQVGALTPDEELLHVLELEEPPVDPAVLGMFLGVAKRKEPGWRADCLRRWLIAGPGRLIVQAVHHSPPNDALAEIALEAVKQGLAEPAELGRFLYGAWARGLSAHVVADIAELIGKAGDDAGLERALGILSTWLEDHPDHQEAKVDETALELIQATTRLAGRRSSMLGLYRERVSALANISFETQIDLMAKILGSLDDGFLEEHDLELLDRLTRLNPSEAIRMVFSVILKERDNESRFSVMWLDHTKILSRLADSSSPEIVADELRRVPADRWRELVSHVSFARDEPDALMEALITETTDEVVRSRAAFAFMYPEDGWMGEESAHLAGRRSLAASWLQRTTSDEMSTWLEELIRELDARIEEAGRRELEEGV